MTTTIAQTSIDAQMLYERIVQLNVGESISYAELSALVGRNVQDEGHGVLATARRMAEREEIVFGTVMGQGIRRLSDPEIVDTGDHAIARVRRAAKRGANTVTAVADFDALPNEKKIKHNTLLSLLGTVTAFMRPATAKKIATSVAQNSGKLSVGDTLRAFGK